MKVQSRCPGLSFECGIGDITVSVCLVGRNPVDSRNCSFCDNANSVQFSSVTQSCPTLCDPMNCSMPGLPVHHQLLESGDSASASVRPMNTHGLVGFPCSPRDSQESSPTPKFRSINSSALSFLPDNIVFIFLKL